MGSWVEPHQGSHSPFDAADAVSSSLSTAALIKAKDPLPAHNANTPLNLRLTVTCRASGLPVTHTFPRAAWHRHLQAYPDPAWTHRLVHDIFYGVDIGYHGCRTLRITLHPPFGPLVTRFTILAVP